MTKHKEAILYAKSIGAVLTEPEYYEHDQSYLIEAEAPEGKQWVAMNSQTLVCRWWTYAKGSKDESLQDLIERMKLGVEEFEE